jgi:hypothetical protein
MHKRIALVAAVVGTAALGLVPASLAGGGNSSNANEGARCVKAGVAFLVTNDLLRAAAVREIDYSDLDTDAGPAPGNDDAYSMSGPINIDPPNGANLSLGEVVRLHFTNPELFDWCA